MVKKQTLKYGRSVISIFMGNWTEKYNQKVLMRLLETNVQLLNLENGLVLGIVESLIREQ